MRRFGCTIPRGRYSIFVSQREAVVALGFDGCSHLGDRDMSTLTTAWASADTMLGCTNISLSYDFGVVMANLGKRGQVCASIDVGGVEEFLEFPAQREELIDDWIEIRLPPVGR